jgi:predicted nucleic acid-binding protein
MSAGRVFFDTNVLLYMHSAADARKQTRAQQLFEEFGGADRILLSTQVIQEFFAAGVRKLALPVQQVREIAGAFLDLPLVVIKQEHIRRAMVEQERFEISFWDALVLVAADAGGAELLLTEDLNDGQVYGPVTVRNPFRTEARLP